MRNIICTERTVAGFGIQFKGSMTKGGGMWFTRCLRNLRGVAMNMFKSVQKRTSKSATALLAVSMLAACDPQPVGDTSCTSAVGCEIVALAAQEMRGDIGENYGGSVLLRNARALGQTLVVDLTLPLSAAAFNEPTGQVLIGQVGPEFAGGFCEGAYARDFFALGNKVRVRGFSRNGQLVADRVVTSCGGARR